MEFLKVFKRKKLLFLNIFFLLYISTNLFTGERGLISYFDKKSLLNNLNNEKLLLIEKVNNIEKKNDLLSKNLNHDLVDILVREKFMYGKKNEVLIKIND
tara:strand:- start:1267 stop:1566 length:300 start_codon:yes stop_codon:yes gene_type:complete